MTTWIRWGLGGEIGWIVMVFLEYEKLEIYHFFQCVLKQVVQPFSHEQMWLWNEDFFLCNKRYNSLFLLESVIEKWKILVLCTHTHVHTWAKCTLESMIISLFVQKILFVFGGEVRWDWVLWDVSLKKWMCHTHKIGDFFNKPNPTKKLTHMHTKGHQNLKSWSKYPSNLNTKRWQMWWHFIGCTQHGLIPLPKRTGIYLFLLFID
jgi:hypothetical protein